MTFSQLDAERSLQWPDRCEVAAVPYRPRCSTGNLVFHVLNRAVEGLTLFEHTLEFALFCDVLTEALGRVDLRLLAYSVMPNHWHLVVWTKDDNGLSSLMQWLTATHAKRWRRARGSHGRGAVYQSRFKAIAVQHDAHLLRLIRYVERNALRARLVPRAADWPWCSASAEAYGAHRPPLSAWPVDRPANWNELLDSPEPVRTLRAIRGAILAGRHYGTPSWRLRTAQTLRWRSGLRQPGRPVVLECPDSLDVDDDKCVIATASVT